MDKGPIHILVLDDEASIRWVLDKTLARPEYRLHQADTAEAAATVMAAEPIDLALVDINLPGGDGLTFFQEQRERHPHLLAIIITGEASMTNAVTAMQRGAYDYLTKPFDIDEVEALVARAAQAVWARRRVKGGAPEPPPAAVEDAIIGKSRSVREVYKSIGRVARTDLAVLILGESGTGKELIARSLHEHSQRAREPFVGVNCAAIPRDLLEMELFGNEKGAFTGAGERKAGKFEAAGAGTIFLDEIGDMSLDLQAKLLRVLQEREFQRVGGLETLQVRARVVAATNQSILQAIGEGGFRSDLYYRLSAFTIVSDPLRERRDDIPLLVQHFLRKGTRDLGLPPRTVTPAVLERLAAYDWPGNVRELENTVKSLMIMTSSPVIDVDDLPRNIAGAAAGEGEARRQTLAGLWEPLVLEYCREGKTGLLEAVEQQVERPLIRRVLQETRGNQVKAARILGINRNTLRARLQAFGIGKEAWPGTPRTP